MKKFKFPIPNSLLLILGSLLVALFLIPNSLFEVQAFTGPGAGQVPGSGSGMISVDPSGNIGFGTENLGLGVNFNTPPSGAFSKIFTLASSSTPPGINLRNIASGCGTEGCSGYSLTPASYVMGITPWGWLEFRDTLSNVRRMFVMNNGYVGIGSAPTTPSALFMVNGGDARFSGNLYSSSSFVGNLSGAMSSANVSSGVFGSLQGNGNFAFPASMGIATSSQNGLPQTLSVYGGGYFSGNVGIGTASPGRRLTISEGTGANTNAYQSFANSAERWVIGNEGSVSYGGGNSFVIYGGTSPSYKVLVDPNGNVGIGTTSPGATLHVVSSGQPSVLLEKTGSNSNSASLMFKDNAPTPNQWMIGTGNVTPTDGKFFIYDYRQLATRLSIDTSGNVGIATTTPNTAKLVVGGAVSGAAIDVAGNKIINVGTPINVGDAANKSYVDSVVGGGGSTGSFTTLTVTGTSTLATTGGNVGIGTASPGTKLDVAGTVRASTLDLSPSGGAFTISSSQINRTDGFVEMQFNAPSGNGVRIFGNTLYPITFSGNGNVGIATTSPAYKLDVVGGGRFSQPVGVGTPINTGDAATKSYVDSSVTGAATQWTTTSTGVYYNSGNVGIRTTSPGAELDVQGQIIGGFGAASTAGTTNWNDSSNARAGNGFTLLYGNATSGPDSTTQYYHPFNFEYASKNGTGNLTQMAIPYTAGDFAWRSRYSNLWSGWRKFWDSGNLTNNLTANYLPKWNSGGTSLANSLLYDNGTNVGIGTSTPAYKLDVVGGGRFSQPVGVGTPINTGDAATKSYVDSSVTGAATQWTTTSTGVFYNGGNVGIGTTNPLAKLDVEGASTDVSIRAGRLGSSYAELYYDYTNFYPQLRSSNGAWLGIEGDQLNLNTGGTMGSRTNRLKVDVNGNVAVNTNQLYVQQSTGNVGIGTSTPAYKLDVWGAGSFTQPVVVGTPINSNQAATKSYVDSSITGGSGSTVGYWTASSTSIYNSNAGNVGIGTASPGANLDISGTTARTMILSSTNSGAATLFNIKSAWDGIAAINFIRNSDSSIRGYVSQNFYGDALTVGAAGKLYLGGSGVATITLTGGNVGIATSTPADKLDVNGNGIFRNNLSADTIYDQGNSGYYIDPAANVMPYSALFAGNVGIGTTGPAYKLEVNGDINIQSTNLLRVNGIAAFGFTGANSDLRFGTTNPTSNMYFYAGSATPSMFMQSATGNVGIGTSTPAYKLDVVGGGRFSQPVGVGTPISPLDAATKNYVDSAVATATSTQYWTASSTSIYYNGGNVGIGTVNPTGNLHVNSGGNTSIIVDAPDGGYGSLSFAKAGTTQFYWTKAPARTDLSLFNASNQEKVTIQQSGNVGIATSTPADKLDVNGNGIFRNNLSADTIYDQGNSGYYIDPAANVMPYSALFAGNVGIGTTSPGATLDIAGSYYSRLVSKGNCTGAVTIDWSAGNIQHCTLTGSVTLTFSNGKSGGNYRLILKQGGTGSYAAGWPASVRWGSGLVPTLTTTVGKSDYVGFIYNGVDSTYDGIAFNANF